MPRNVSDQDHGTRRHTRTNKIWQAPSRRGATEICVRLPCGKPFVDAIDRVVAESRKNWKRSTYESDYPPIPGSITVIFKRSTMLILMASV
jgi:hypothetical protein